jgi:ArsR family transcriptional regulator
MSNKINNLDPYKVKQQEVFSTLSNTLMALSSPVRIKLIHFLSQAPLTVEVLAHKVEQSMANTSMHLRKMLREGIVSVQQDGQKRVYHLGPAVQEFWESCQNFLGQLKPSLNDIVDSSDLEINWQNSLEKTLKNLKNKEAILLDIRPKEEILYTSENILEKLNYVHVPLEELQTYAKKIPKKIPILIMCRGKYCALSTQALSILKDLKLNAYRLPYSWFAILKKLKETT